MQKVLLYNGRFVVKYINRFYMLNIEEDLLQVGLIGVMRAVAEYDEKVSAFTVFELVYIRAECIRYLKECHNWIRMPQLLAAEWMKTQRYIEETGSVPLEADLIHNFGMSKGHAKMLRPYICGCESTDDIISMVDSSTDIQNASDPIEGIIEKDMISSVRKLLDNKVGNAMDRKILEMRFGFFGADPMTFDEIGIALKRSRSRIQQRESRALRCLRYDICNSGEGEELKAYIEEC